MAAIVPDDNDVALPDVGVFTALLKGFELLPLALDPVARLLDLMRLLPLVLLRLLLFADDNLVLFVSSTSPRISLLLQSTPE